MQSGILDKNAVTVFALQEPWKAVHQPEPQATNYIGAGLALTHLRESTRTAKRRSLSVKPTRRL